jgi:hypothetical protein
MQAQTVTRDDNRYDLSHLSDSAVLAGTRRLVGTSNQLFADLLAHLAEVEARGIHRIRACASLYTYCIYELRFSEDAAFRRVSAARLVKTFPALFDSVASGELHLTGLLMLGPHLTHANLAEVLARAKHRSKRELGQLIREIDPLPNVPARIEPLGPAEPSPAAPRNPTWEQFMRSLNPVRELAPGERPRDWIDKNALLPCASRVTDDATPPAPDGAAENEPEPAPARNELTLCGPAPITGPQRYCVQFTATEEYVRLVERAKALLSQATVGASLEELHLRAMQSLVTELEKRKYAVTTKRLAKSDAAKSAKLVRLGADAHADSESSSGSDSDSDARSDSESSSGSDSDSDARSDSESESLGDGDGHNDANANPRQRGRYVPARIRREVFERDEARCSYVDERGERCRETTLLELHHLQSFALGGAHCSENLALRCRAHNVLAAEQDFGRTYMEQQRNKSCHEPLRPQKAP